MSGHRGGFLLFVLGCMILFDECESNWLQKAQDSHVCEGGSVTFGWRFDESVDVIRGTSVYKAGTPPLDILSKARDQNVTVFQEGYSYVPNAGFSIERASLEHAGRYNVRVVFENDTYNLADQKELTVHTTADCPDADEYSNPDVSVVVIDIETIENTTCDVSSSSARLPVTVTVTTNVPRADPVVEAYIEEKSGANATCYGTGDGEILCTKNVTLETFGNHSINVLLTYIGYQPQETIVYCNIQAPGTTWSNVIVILIIAFFVLLVLLIFLVCFLYMCCKKLDKSRGGTTKPKKSKKGVEEPHEGSPMVAYPNSQGGEPRTGVPVQARDDQSVDPYKCFCSLCPEDADEFCCQEIATFDSLTDGHYRCITQTPKFEDIFRHHQQRPVSNEERRAGAMKAIGFWIWHMEDKKSGFPACFLLSAKKVFPVNRNSPAQV